MRNIEFDGEPSGFGRGTAAWLDAPTVVLLAADGTASWRRQGRILCGGEFWTCATPTGSIVISHGPVADGWEARGRTRALYTAIMLVVDGFARSDGVGYLESVGAVKADAPRAPIFGVETAGPPSAVTAAVPVPMAGLPS